MRLVLLIDYVLTGTISVSPSTLSEWLQGIPRLESLTVWSGNALSQHAGDTIRNHCPGFKHLTIYRWYGLPMYVMGVQATI